MSRVGSFVVGVAFAASLLGNLVLVRMHVGETSALENLEALDAAHREERDLLMELIPAVTLDVGVADIEAYLGAVYSGEEIGVVEDPRCVGCVVVSWRSFRFAFDATGRLSNVHVAS